MTFLTWKKRPYPCNMLNRTRLPTFAIACATYIGDLVMRFLASAWYKYNSQRNWGPFFFLCISYNKTNIYHYYVVLFLGI